MIARKMSCHNYGRLRLLPCVVLGFLSACGGGDSSNTPTTIPTPTPTPTPSTTPTPSPTPSAYQVAFDFTRDRTFDGLVTASTTQTVPARLTYGGFDSGTITYTASSGALSSFSNVIVPNTNGATLTRSDSQLVYKYSIATSGVTLTVNKASPDAIYVSYIRSDELVKPLSITRFALLGAPTLVADIPSAATTTYRLTLAEIGNQLAGQTLSIDWAFKRIDGSVILSIPGKATSITTTFRGNLDSSNGRIDGTVSTLDGTYSGAFHGRIYGPAGAEIGMIIDLQDSMSNLTTALIFGRAG